MLRRIPRKVYLGLNKWKQKKENKVSYNKAQGLARKKYLRTKQPTKHAAMQSKKIFFRPIIPVHVLRFALNSMF